MNPLLSRKRPLVGHDCQPIVVMKKLKSEAAKKDEPKTTENLNQLYDNPITNQQEEIEPPQDANSTETNEDEEKVERKITNIENNLSRSERLASFSHASPRPSATPRPTAIPRPSATPRPTATPRPIATPRPTATPKQQSKKTPSILKGSCATRRMDTPRNRKTISFTPLQRSRRDSEATDSVLRSAPHRRSISTIKYRNMQLTPHPRKLNALPEDSVLKSAPSRRRSMSMNQKLRCANTPQSAAKNIPHGNSPPRSAIRLPSKVMSGKPQRRHTMHFTGSEDIPSAVAPFTPRGEWQNTDLSVR